MPPRVVVVLGGLVQAEGQVVVGPDPLGRVDRAGLERGEDLAAGQRDRRAACLGERLAADAGDAHLEALEVVDRVDLAPEPAAHLRAGVAARRRDDPERLVGLLPELEPTAEVEPRIHFLRREPEGDGREERSGRDLALPVVGRTVPHLRGATRDRVEHLEGGYKLVRSVHLDRDPSSAARLDHAPELARAGPESREIGRPGRHHPPVERACVRGALGFTRFLCASGRGRCDRTESQSLNHLPALHGFPPRLVFCQRPRAEYTYHSVDAPTSCLLIAPLFRPPSPDSRKMRPRGQFLSHVVTFLALYEHFWPTICKSQVIWGC